MQTTDGFDMTAVAEHAAAVQASLFDDVVHVVDERGPAIPTRLNIAGCTDDGSFLLGIVAAKYNEPLW